jgi:hypothetical protein
MILPNVRNPFAPDELTGFQCRNLRHRTARRAGREFRDTALIAMQNRGLANGWAK